MKHKVAMMKTTLLFLILLSLFTVILEPVHATKKTETFEAKTQDGTLKQYSKNGYSTLWNYSTGTIEDSLDETALGQKNEYISGILDADTIFRTILFFATSPIHDSAKIKSAELKVYGITLYEDRTFTIKIQKGTDEIPHNPLETGDYWQGYYTGSYGELASSSFLTNNWNTISLTTFDCINLIEDTKLILRTDREINADEPPNNSLEYIKIATAESSQPPTLTITYSIEGAAGEPPPPWWHVKWEEIKELLKAKVQTPVWNLWTQAVITFEGIVSSILIILASYYSIKLVYGWLFKPKRKWKVIVKERW